MKDRGIRIQADESTNDIALKVEHVSKTFRLPHNRQNSLKGSLINLVKGGDRTYEKQEVLKDVSFEIKRGEFFGIVGRNGSGKSTLLKMLAGIYKPTKGNITVNGSLTPFIELGVGFNPELTGRENVFLNGALLGFDNKEMLAMYDDIVKFAELERFMDQKLKNYSSGMQVRLAFSIAIRAKSAILLIDEVLAVGDASFQQKCYEYFGNMKKTGQTVVLVTHDMSAVAKFCSRALLLADGDIMKIGKPKEITDAYLELNFTGIAADSPTKNLSANSPKISSVALLSETKNTMVTSVITGESCKIKFEFQNPGRESLQFGLQIFNDAGTYCFGTNTSVSNIDPVSFGHGEVCMDIKLDLVPGNYSITGAIMNENATKVLVYRPRLVMFRVADTTGVEGVTNLKHEWSIKSV